MIETSSEDLFANQPAFEPLVENPPGMHSRRINRQHRFAYEVFEGAVIIDDRPFEGTVKVLSMWTHYETL